jgi:multiple sugar transport system permease protein
MSARVFSRGGVIRVWLYLLVVFLVVLFFFPIAWIFLTSIKTTGEIYAWPPVYFPRHPTVENYRVVFFESFLGRYILNSILVSSLSTVSVICIGSVAGYGIARIRFRGAMIILVFFLSMSMFPQLAIVPSVFLSFRRIGLVNNYLGLAIAYNGLFLPMAVWILSTYFRTIPQDIEDSARIDGCTATRILWQMIAPLSLPGLVAAGLIVFIFSWNEFLMALVLLSKNLLRTATVGIALYPGEYAFPWELISTATFLAILPLLLLTFLFQKRIISGLTAGSIR